MQASTHDLRVAISAHPWTAVVVAVAAGACLALVESRASRSAFGRSVTAILGSTTLALVRELATRHGSAYARSWLEAHLRPRARA